MRPASEVAARLGRCWLAADYAATSLEYMAAISEPAAIIEADRAELVAEIVAWLRRQEDIAFDRMRNAATTDRMGQYAGAGTAIQACANLLETGEWKK